MKDAVNYFNVGHRLTLTFVALVALILGGNGLLIWQFHTARLQTDRLTVVSRQLIAVQQLQEQLLIVHQRLDEIARSKDANRLVVEAQPLVNALLEQTQQTRNTLPHLPSALPVDPLEAIEVTVPSQLAGITALAKSGDWGAVNLRLANQLKPMETQTSALVSSIDNEVSGEMTQAVANMGSLQRRILLIVPTTAILTVLVAAFFGWSIARRMIELRMDERAKERSRIAVELHDSLLQGFQGLMFRLQAVRDLLPRRPDEAAKALDIALERGDEAIAEGRDTVSDLREPIVSDKDIAAALTALGEELTAQGDNGSVPCVRVLVEGKHRELNPMLRDEIYRIGREALRNAFRHARAQKIEAEITYGDSEFLFHIRDDGGGIDPAIANQGSRAGHWGLPGMRERAKSFGGKLEVWSEQGAGTEIVLSVPAAIAYGGSGAGAGARRRFRFLRKKIGVTDGKQP